MEIRIKLMGMLKGHWPAGEMLRLADGACIADALGVLGIPADTVQIVTVNGQLERNRQRVLAAGDELTVLPPVGGG